MFPCILTHLCEVVVLWRWLLSMQYMAFTTAEVNNFIDEDLEWSLCDGSH